VYAWSSDGVRNGSGYSSGDSGSNRWDAAESAAVAAECGSRVDDWLLGGFDGDLRLEVFVVELFAVVFDDE
jgi:hypothetical protein